MIVDLSRWAIDCAASSGVAATARDELDTGLRRVTGCFPTADAECVRIQLRHGSDRSGDGFRREVGDAEIVLIGDGPRGLLYAVYDLFEDLGCAWPGPGVERWATGVRFDLHSTVERPTMPSRVLNGASQPFFDELDGWLVWAARSRLNGVCMHVEPPDAGLGACPPWTAWEAGRSTVRAAAERYGFDLELGGHWISWLLPRDRFETMPDAFRMVDGARTPLKNLCVSNPVGLAVAAERARELAVSFPEITVFHLWVDDLPGAGWCACPGCEALSAADQALRFTNAVAEGVRLAGGDATVTYLAYEDTDEPPAPASVAENVALLWAPMRRSYAAPASSIDDPQNRATFAERFTALVENFRARTARPHRVFEYYLGAITFPVLLPPLPTVIAADLAYYAAGGAASVSALVAGPRRHLSPPPNLSLFARLSWDATIDVDDLLAEMGDAVFGAGGESWARYWRLLEQAFAAVIPVSPHQFPPRDEQSAVMLNPALLYRQGLSDAQNAQHLPDGELQARLTSAAGVPALLAEADAALDALREGADDARWQAEAAELALARVWFGFIIARLAFEAAGRSGDAAAMAETYAVARQCHADALAWSARHLTDREDVGVVQLLHILWRLPLDAARARQLSGDKLAAHERERDDESARVFARVLAALG